MNEIAPPLMLGAAENPVKLPVPPGMAELDAARLEKLGFRLPANDGVASRTINGLAAIRSRRNDLFCIGLEVLHLSFPKNFAPVAKNLRV
jgi:hypothetical protein